MAQILLAMAESGVAMLAFFNSNGQTMMEAAFLTRGGSISFGAIIRVMVVGMAQILLAMAEAGMAMLAFFNSNGQTMMEAAF